MTIAADAFRRRDTAEFTRWTTCLLIVIALHCAALLLILRHRVPFQPVGAPPAAVIIDLAPAPPAPSEAAPPAEPTPPQPEQLVLPEPAPAPAVEPSPTPHPAVVLPLPQPPKPKPKAKPVERPPVQQREPAVVPAPVAAPPAPSPAPASPASSTVNVRATWQAQLLAWLERHSATHGSRKSSASKVWPASASLSIVRVGCCPSGSTRAQASFCSMTRYWS